MNRVDYHAARREVRALRRQMRYAFPGGMGWHLAGERIAQLIAGMPKREPRATSADPDRAFRLAHARARNSEAREGSRRAALVRAPGESVFAFIGRQWGGA